MNDSDFGKFILRFTIGTLMLFHGYSKLMYGFDAIEETLNVYGIPIILAYCFYISEIVAPLGILLGYYTRLWSVIIAVSIIISVYLFHSNDWFELNQSGMLILEVEYFFLFTSLSLIFIGAGRYSFDTQRSKRNF